MIAEKPRSFIAKTCVRLPGRGVLFRFQAKEDGSQAQKIHLGARPGGAIW